MIKRFEDRKHLDAFSQKRSFKYQKMKMNREISLYQIGIIVGAFKKEKISTDDVRAILKEKFNKREIRSLTSAEADELIGHMKIQVIDSSG